MTSGSRIFISYSSKDQRVARRLYEQLAQAGFAPWLDLHEIALGDSIAGRIDQGLSAASYLVLLASHASLESKWVTREWRSALSSPGTVIIPVLLDDVVLPPLLGDLAFADLRSDEDAGIARVVEFFAKETAQPRRAPTRSQGGLCAASRRKVRLVALACIDDAALNAFCFDAGIDPRSLAGASLHDKVMALLHRADREDLLDSFIDWIELEHGRCVAAQLKRLASSSDWRIGPSAA